MIETLEKYTHKWLIFIRIIIVTLEYLKQYKCVHIEISLAAIIISNTWNHLPVC